MNDPDAEVPFDGAFLFPVLFSFFFRVFFQNDNFRQLCYSRIGPDPGNVLYPAADFPKNPFQKRGGFRGDHSGFQPQLKVGKDAPKEVFQIGGPLLIAMFFEDIDQRGNFSLAGAILFFDRLSVLLC